MFECQVRYGNHLIKMKKFLLTGISLAAVLACSRIDRSSELKIIGGIEDWNFHGPAVGLDLKMPPGWGGVCSGTVVGDDLVLTAAHCLVDVPAERVRIVGKPGRGETDLVFTQGVENIVSTRLVHPDYFAGHSTQTIGSDIAFIVFPKGSLARFKKAHIATLAPNVGDLVTMVGIGDTAIFDPTSNPERKLFSGSNRIDAIDSKHHGVIYIKSEKVGMDEANAGPGDSGGPLINGSGELIGVAHAITWSDGKAIRSNEDISHERPLQVTYVNLTDSNVARFIRETLDSRQP
jgi:hypothetical protein